MSGIDLVHREATKTNIKQDAAYILQFHAALKELNTKIRRSSRRVGGGHVNKLDIRNIDNDKPGDDAYYEELVHHTSQPDTENVTQSGVV